MSRSLNYKVDLLYDKVNHIYCYLKKNPGGTEVDPVFTSSVAYTITQSDIDFWNTGGSIPGLQAVTDVGRHTTNPIESDDFVTGQWLAVKNNGFLGAIDGSLLSQGQSYQLPDKSGTVALLEDIHPEVDTLDTVVNRGAYSSKPISFLSSTTTPALGDPIGAIGIHKPTYSYYWGDFSQAATGLYNVSISYGALQKLTSGSYNIGIGVFAGKELTTGKTNTLIGSLTGQKTTTGNYNAMFGNQAGNENTTGYKNTYFGTYAGYNNITSNFNVLIGYKSGNQNAMGDRNLFLGSFAGQGVTGTNNLILGVGAGNNDGAINNRLIIHNNTTLSGYGALDTQEGILGSPTQGNLANALITGAFDQRWVKLNGYLQIGAGYMPNAQGDATFSKRIVAKPDGVIGWEDKVTVTTTSATMASAPDVSGYLNIRKTNNLVELAGSIVLNASYNKDNPFANLPLGYGMSNNTFSDTLVLHVLVTNLGVGAGDYRAGTVFLSGNALYFLEPIPTDGISIELYQQYTIL